MNEKDYKATWPDLKNPYLPEDKGCPHPADPADDSLLKYAGLGAKIKKVALDPLFGEPKCANNMDVSVEDKWRNLYVTVARSHAQEIENLISHYEEKISEYKSEVVDLEHCLKHAENTALDGYGQAYDLIQDLQNRLKVLECENQMLKAKVAEV